MTRFSPPAAAAIQAVFDDPAQQQLADRIEELLDLLDKDPGDRRLRRLRMHTPKLWAVPVHGSGRDLLLLWDLDEQGEPFVRYAGDGI